MDSAIVQSGTFTSTGVTKNLSIRSDIDWMYVYNYDVLSAAGAGTGAQFYWQRGMAQGTGIEYKKTNAAQTLEIAAMAAPTGFTLLDQGNQNTYLSTGIAFTGISNATSPVVLTGTTSGISVGDVIIMSQTAAQRTTADATVLMGIPFTVGAINAGVSFTIEAVLSQAPGAGIAAAAGTWRKVNVSSIFYPQQRYIVKVDVTAPTAPIISTSARHGYQVGQEVYFAVPSVVNGMVQLNQLTGTITVASTATAADLTKFTVNIDTTGFTAFTFPTAVTAAAASPFTPANVAPAGMNTAQALSSGVNILNDATDNVAIIGMSLAAGADSPAGVDTNVIYWVAGKSSYINNG